MKRNTIISHRLRGFDTVDASLAGLRSALSQGLAALEIDTRITADGAIVIHHDPFFTTSGNEKLFICEYTVDELRAIADEGRIAYMPALLDEFFREICRSGQNPEIYLDIKEFGKEEEIYQLITETHTEGNVVIVSWLPEVLFAFHKLDKSLPLCFSHYPLVPGEFLKNTFLRLKYIHEVEKVGKHRVFYPVNKYNKTDLDKYAVENKPGDDYEHLVTAPISGELLEVLQSVNSMVCCDIRLTNRKLMKVYHALGIKVAVYSIRHEREIRECFDQIGVDFILSDNHELCLRG